jgi:hypothetical protein
VVEAGARKKELGEAFYRRAGARGAVELPDSGELPGAAINGAQRRRGDATAGRYRRGRWSRGGGRSGAKLSCVAGWQRGGRRRRPEVTSARGWRTDDEAADRWGRSACESERARASDWQVGSACQREREGARSGLARARRQAGSGPREEERGRERGGSCGCWAEIRSNRAGRGFFLFLFFTFQTPFPLFAPFLLNKIFCEYSKCLESRI